jgi:hypothetical protein
MLIHKYSTIILVLFLIFGCGDKGRESNKIEGKWESYYQGTRVKIRSEFFEDKTFKQGTSIGSWNILSDGRIKLLYSQGEIKTGKVNNNEIILEDGHILKKVILNNILLDNYYPPKEGLKRIMLVKSITTSGTKIIEEGNRRYSHIYSPVQDLHGKTVFPLKTTILGMPTINLSNLIFVANDLEGIYVVGTQVIRDNKPNEIEFKNTKYYMLKNPIKVGNEWWNEAGSHLKRPTIQIKMKAAIDNIDDTVSVPAGTFEECVKVSRSGGIIVQDGTNIKKEFTAWYAPGVGLVKYIDIETMTENDKTMMVKIVNELESME